MLISILLHSYIRPHRHPRKTESLHIVEGALDVVLFTPDGLVCDVIRMGEYQSGRTFYYRLSEPIYHTVVVRSDVAIIHETTNGPFEPAATEFAPWAPEEMDVEGISQFMCKLEFNTNVTR